MYGGDPASADDCSLVDPGRVQAIICGRAPASLHRICFSSGLDLHGPAAAVFSLKSQLQDPSLWRYGMHMRLRKQIIPKLWFNLFLF